MTEGDPVVTFFSEDRLGTSSRGAVSADPKLADFGWARGLPDTTRARFAARVDPTAVADGYVVQGRVVPLPYYQGGSQLLRKAPKSSLAVWRTVRSSDVVAVRLPGVVGLLAVVAATVLRKTMVIEVVGDIHEVLNSGVGGAAGRRLARPMRAITRWAVRRGAVVRYVTTHRLQDVYPSNDSAHVFAFSDVELEQADLGPASVPIDHSPRIIAVGSQEQAYKGQDLLISALAELRGRGHDVTLALLGRGKFQNELGAQAARLGVAQHVEFRGHVSPRSAVRSELDRAWVFAMPSRTEGLPRALVEAMARRKACVVTRVGGMPELVESEFVVPSDDVVALTAALARLITEGPVRRQQENRNRRVAEQLASQWEVERSKWRTLLTDFAQGRRDG